MKNIACFDIGGTFIKYAILNSNGEIIFKDRYETPNHNCKITIPESISIRVNEMKSKYDVDRIGICTAGVVDSKNGIVVWAPNMQDYSGAKLSEYIKAATGIDTYIENDVNAAALGEMWMGAAKGIDTFICITLGTGVGGAIVVDGKVLKGVSGGAGEIGHMIIMEAGDLCNCGTKGCYERYAATSALVRAYIKEAKIESSDDINGEYILKLVRSGDVTAVKVYNEFLNYVVTGLVGLTHIIDPGTIVIGGGISAIGEEFFNEINKRFKERVIKFYAERTNIISARLKNDAGIYGACYLALMSKEK